MNSEPEVLSTATSSFSESQAEKFFQAVAWQLPTRPETPPTMATIFRESEFKALHQLGIPLDRVLHTEQSYRFHQALKAGQSYTAETALKSRLEKTREGKQTMAFYVFETRVKGDAGQVCVECQTTIVVRSLNQP